MLRPLRKGDEADVMQAQAELADDDFDFAFLRPGEPWITYLTRVERERCGLDLDPGRVPATFLVAEADGTVVGRVSIRHELNEFLAANGGHIGYAVRPAFRRRGYAASILRQALPIAAGLGSTRVLVTCDDTNVASVKVIEGCGGVLANVVPGDGRPPIRRYWIERARD